MRDRQIERANDPYEQMAEAGLREQRRADPYYADGWGA